MIIYKLVESFLVMRVIAGIFAVSVIAIMSVISAREEVVSTE